MRYLNLYEEFTSSLKSEVDIIYRSKDLIVLMPKSPYAAYSTGRKTQWCTSGVSNAFDLYNKENYILIRFIFKDGNKIRLTYNIKNHKCDWGNQKGLHLIKYESKEPFCNKIYQDVKRDNEKELIKLIDRIDPDAKQKVNDYVTNIKEPHTYQQKEMTDKQREVLNILDDLTFNLAIEHEYRTTGFLNISFSIPNSNYSTVLSVWVNRNGILFSNANRTTLDKIKLRLSELENMSIEELKKIAR